MRKEAKGVCVFGGGETGMGSFALLLGERMAWGSPS